MVSDSVTGRSEIRATEATPLQPTHAPTPLFAPLFTIFLTADAVTSLPHILRHVRMCEQHTRTKNDQLLKKKRRRLPGQVCFAKGFIAENVWPFAG